jgi:hypothetical protein
LYVGWLAWASTSPVLMSIAMAAPMVPLVARTFSLSDRWNSYCRSRSMVRVNELPGLAGTTSL